MKWRVETSTMFTGLMTVYDEDGNSVVRDKIPEHARLIAAAPNMLEACQYTLENLQHYMTNNQIFISAMESLQKAVDKAEGGDA